ncbi:hypothetical protein ACTJJ0_03775 [Chitinophaga sp. 22321]|nr:hypothetical protein [Chitinophaga hostae]
MGNYRKSSSVKDSIQYCQPGWPIDPTDILPAIGDTPLGYLVM